MPDCSVLCSTFVPPLSSEGLQVPLKALQVKIRRVLRKSFPIIVVSQSVVRIPSRTGRLRLRARQSPIAGFDEPINMNNSLRYY